jgi:acyl-CoA synthetase (NDP forming)
VPDIGKLLWPRSVAVIGASSDTDRLRGRIVRVLRSHPFRGPIYPVCRSETEVQGLKAFRSVAELPEAIDLAVLIIPAEFVPRELERCGAAGVPAALILSSGFAEEAGATGHALQSEIRAIALRYDMAVSGPNGEGFANTAAALCPTFSPVMETGGVPSAASSPRTGPEVAVVSQSGGMGFAFLDRGRSRHLPFRYVVTTGNEACLETFDFVDYMLDEGKVDVFLLLIEDVKNLATFERVAAKALRAGKPLIACKLGQSEAGTRAVLSHTGARAGSHDDYRATFSRHGVIEASDLDEMTEIAAAFVAFGQRLPAGKRVGICTSSGGGGAWVADTCVAAGLEVPLLDGATRAVIDQHLPSYGTSQNPVDVTAQALHRMGYARFAQMLAGSPAVDGVIVVVTARSPRMLERDHDALAALARETSKPIFMWSYTQPTDTSVRILNETGYPLFTSARNCARAMRVMAEYRAARERLTR